MLEALLALDARVADGPLLRLHELRLAEHELGYLEREHACDCLIEKGLVEKRIGVFDRGFSECVHLVDRPAAVKALTEVGVHVPVVGGEAIAQAGHLTRPSALAERAA